MTTLHERFQAIKDALHNAINLADPEAAVREAEEAFKASIVAEVTDLRTKVDALTAALAPTAPAAPAPVVAEVAPVVALAPVAADPAPATPAA